MHRPLIPIQVLHTPTLPCAVLFWRCRAAAAAEEEEGYEALAGGDVEAVERAAKAREQRAGEEQHSWITLFWEACAVVWPEDK